MAELHFRCSNTYGRVLDGRVAEMDDLSEACEYATRIARSLIATPNLRDWRDFSLRVSDDLGEEVFVVPFWSILGKPH